jgi:quaternary ammonium compound-resistance protein SugE
MAWLFLVIAGLLEVAWATGLKRLGLGFSWSVGALTAIAMIASLGGLYAAMARLPIGVAYPIWTGIGAVGSVVMGVVLYDQTPGMNGMLGVALLVAGMFLIGNEFH